MMGIPDDIIINAKSWQVMEGDNPEQSREWHDGEGVFMQLACIGVDQDLRDLLSDINDVRRSYRDSLAGQGVGIIQCDIVEVCGQPAVKVVGKKVEEGRAAIYLGTLAMPLPAESYVLSLYAQEVGTTGLRDTAVFMKMQMAGTIQPPDENDGAVEGWASDPYFPEYNGPSLKNLSDAPEYDAEFPEHPLTKVRLRVDELSNEIGFSRDLVSRLR